MNLITFYQEANDFKNRIIQAFRLKQDHAQIIPHKKIIFEWLRKKQQDLEKQIKSQSSSNIIKAILQKSQLEKKKKKLQKQILLHQQLKSYFKSKTLQNVTNIEEFIQQDFFKQIRESLTIFFNNPVQQYYGVVKAPLIGSMFIEKKQDFKFCVENSPHHNLKFIVTEAKVAHKYQRNLVQQVFGRVIRKKGALSLMIKIQIDVLPDQKDIDIYCYIEDLSFKGDQFKQIQELVLTQKNEETFAFELKTDEGQVLQINRESLLQIFLSQMIVIPVQTLVSDFIIQVSKDGADIIKYHQGKRQEIGQSTLLKDHPSIRNPLFYFRDYIAKNQIHISEILKFNTKKIYGNFYCSLNIISKLMINDFSFHLDENRINSLCFNIQTFCNIWQIIHELVMISDWIEEVIRPIKQTVTIFEMINKFCPILTNMLTLSEKNFSHYRDHLINLEADTFMANYVPKSSIQRYKDLYISLHNYDDPNVYQDRYEVYNKIFAPIMDEFNLASCDIYEAVYFLNFVGQNKIFILKGEDSYHSSWKNLQVWKEVYALKQHEDLPYIDLYIDMLGFYLNIDTVELSNKPFIYVKNQQETPEFLIDLQNFITWMRTNLEKKSHNHLSILFQKAYKYKKYKICNVLLKYDILMNEFEDIFEFDQKLSEDEQLEKERLSHNMRKISPQMYRKLKWEQLMRVRSKKQDQDSVPVSSVKYGKIFIKKNFYETMEVKEIDNNISRKDYMFDPERRMIKVQFSQGNDAYIQFTEYPLVRYFYRLFLQKLNKAHLMPNFTAILNDQGIMLHLIESIPAGLNFQKGYNSFSQTDLKNLCDKDELSESIILSIILMPSKIQLKNIIAVPADTPNNSIFMIDLKQSYRSSPIQKNEGNYYLKSINCLFTFDQMFKSISTNLMKKYSNMEVLSFVQNIFLDLSKLIKNVNEMKKQVNMKNSEQLLGLIFQKNFIINLTEWIFKIQNCFKDCLDKKKSICHMKVLNLINPELSYFYEQVIKSTPSLVERQKILFDEMWRKSFVNKVSMVQFFASSSIIPEPLNVFPNHYRKLCFDGPTQNLNNLYNQSKKFEIFENNPQKLNPFHHETLQYYIRNLDYSKLNPEQRKTAVSKLQQKSKQYLTKKGCLPLTVIRFQDIEILKANELNFAYERLKQAIFENIKTTDSELSAMTKMLLSVMVIKMKNISGLTSIGESSFLQSPLQLRNLRILSICQCAELKTIEIKCDALETVTLRDNPLLDSIYINSFSLKNLDCSGSNVLKLQNIGIYILKGINILLSEVACDGYLKKLMDKSYSAYVLNILKFLLNRLKQSQIKAIIITTLNKLKLLDEQIASTLLGVSSMSQVTNMILKLNVDLQKKVYLKLIDLFFNNEMIQSFIATDMNLTNNIEQIATYMKENCKKYKNSFKQTKINQIVKNNFECFQKIFTFINLNKHYKLNIEGLKLEADDEAIQIIDLLINKREDLEKVDLLIQDSGISTNLFEVIFRTKNVLSLQISQSTISNGISNSESIQNLKELKIKNTLIKNFQLLNKLDCLVELSIDTCELPFEVQPFYSSIGKKKNLKILKFINQRPINKNIDLKILFENLKQLPKLSSLNLSRNYFNEQQLALINDFTKNSDLEELILRSFYEKGQKYSIFSQFLKDSNLRELIIQFYVNDKENLKSFIESLSSQKTIVKLYLHTETEIQSEIFAPLNQNKTLNIIDSDQSIPTWLKKHLKSNKIEKSKLSLNNRNTGAEYDIFMAKQSKFCDYHKLGLSMDGGGIRGLLLATELQYLANQVGYPLHKIFDVIGGTSIGGILALTISTSLDGNHPIMNPTELKQFISVQGKQIFKKSQIRSIANLYDTKYSPANIQKLLNYYFKDCKLSDTLKQTNCIVTAVNRINNKDVIFKSTDAILNKDKDFYVKDIARATSAAPTYFPSAEIKNVFASEKYSLVDGGMGMNNPSKIVIDEIKKMAFNSRNENNYFLLSLGTGRLPSENIPEYAGIKDLAPIIDSFTESSCYFTERDLTQNYKGHFLRVSPLINLSKRQGQLDNTDSHILKTYQDTGLSAAKDFFSNTIIFGKYRTMSLVQWLRENTQRKYEI